VLGKGSGALGVEIDVKNGLAGQETTERVKESRGNRGSYI
jgi:hypothetical protein